MTMATPVAELARTSSRRWLLAALLFVLFRALPNLSYPIGRDQATYFVIGEGLLRGLRLYRDLWDIKPPGIYVLYSGLGRIFGQVMWSVGLVDILWMLAISYCIFRFTERFLGPPAAAVAVAVNAAWHCANGYVDAGQPECFIMLLVFAGYFLVSHTQQKGELTATTSNWQTARDLLAGVCLGAAFWLKYNALAFLPLLAVVPFLDWSGLDQQPRRWRLLISRRAWLGRVGEIIAGFLIVVVAVLGYFLLTGTWASFREGQLQVVPRYAMAPEMNPHFWAAATGSALLGLGLWTLAATGASLLIAERHDLSHLLPILAAAAMGFVSTASQLRFPPYAFETCYPFLAAVWGYLAWKAYQEVNRTAQQRPGQWRAKVLAGALLAVVAVGPLRAEVKEITERYRDLAWWRRDSADFFARYPAVHFVVENLEGQLQVIHALRGLSSRGDGLFVWGTAPLIYYLTGLRPPTRFAVTNHPLISPWAPAEWREELVQDLQKSPPAFLVVERGDQVPGISLTNLDSEQFLALYPRLSRFVSCSYDFMAEFRNFVVYRRKLPGTTEKCEDHLAGQ